MKSKIVIILTLFITLTFFVQHADARRFGGGRSIGKSWSRSTQGSSGTSSFFGRDRSSQSANKSSTNSFSKSRSSNKRSALKGAFMGLLAGGLLSSLLFGGGFHGFQGMDFLIIFAIGFFLFRLLQKRNSFSNLKSAYANTQQQSNNQFQQQNHSYREHDASNRPHWFNEQAFMEQASQHFLSLQEAWDNNNLRLIQSYCSSELYEEISKERLKYSGLQKTEVINLDVKLLDFIQDGEFIVVGIQYSAQLKSNNQSVENIRETWSIAHDKDQARGDWLIVGIEQN